MLTEKIKPKYWKWAEGKIFGIKYLQKFGPLGYGGFTLKEWQELKKTGLCHEDFKLTIEGYQTIIKRLENKKLALTAPLKFSNEKDLKLIAIENAKKYVAGWGAFWN